MQKMKKPKIKKLRMKISRWKWLDAIDIQHFTEFGTIPNLTGYYFNSKKVAMAWKDEYVKKGNVWDCKLFKLDFYFKECK